MVISKMHIWITSISVIIITCLITLGFSEKGETIQVAVLHAGQSETWMDIYQNFSQPLLMNLRVEALDIDKVKKIDLNKYDLVYPDISVMQSPAGKNLQENMLEYINNGGAVFLENSFYNWLPKEVLGVSSFSEISKMPEALDFPAIPKDLVTFQKLVRDFTDNYRNFERFRDLKDKSYGYGIVPSTAVPIVNSGDTALYTLNYYGKGYVFFANLLLPNPWYISGFDMQPKSSEQLYFNNTVSAANQMIRNEAAAFLAKQKFGYALKKVFGPYGRPAMAWQNHFEVLSAIEEQSIEKWIDITKKYNQIPSYSLARGVYEWFVRYESIGYQINRGTNENMAFDSEQAEAFYAAGKHPVVGGKWLNQAKYPNEQSYFNEADLPYRAYPYLVDLAGDGVLDIVSGSSDGYFYFYHGLKKSEEEWSLDKPQRLKDQSGAEIHVDGYSAPVLFDINGDGKLDLISGCENGNIYIFENEGNLHFVNRGNLVKMPSDEKLSAPDIGDIDGDSIADLIVGTESGKIYMFKGQTQGSTLNFGEHNILKDSSGNAIQPGLCSAPRLIDVDGNGKYDLVVGNADGYIRKFINTDAGFIDGGFFDNKYTNDKGNKHFKYGNNAVPAFADINGDGKTDLVVGRLEYGDMAVAIDSPFFPYHNQLVAALKYAKQNYVNVEPHVYTHIYKESEDEKNELELQKKAFEKLGQQWAGKGTNQHTWQVSSENPVQTFLNEYDSELVWNSGFKPANSKIDPSTGTEYTWILPFYLCEGTDPTGMLMFNTTLNNISGLTNYVGTWDTLVSYYRHAEYDTIRNPSVLEKLAIQLDQFRNHFDYNFMSEDQMAKSLMTQLNSSIIVKENPNADKFSITLSPVVKIDKHGLIDGPYDKVTGVKVEPGEKYLNTPLDTDADIFIRKGNNLYIGLNKPVKIYISNIPKERLHIERVNLPVEVKKYNDRMKIKFLDGGLQQIKFHAPNSLQVLNSNEWKVEKLEDDEYVLTRFGGPAELNIKESTKI